MAKKKYPLLLIAEAVLLIFIRFMTDSKFSDIFELLSLPLTKCAQLLGSLSEKGTAANSLSLALYGLICSIPLFFLISKINTKKFTKTDLLLIPLSASLFILIYLLINPAKLALTQLGGESADIISFSFWAILMGYLILRFTDYLKNSQRLKKEQLLKIILRFIGGVFVFALCSTEYSQTGNDPLNLIGFFNSAVPHLFAIATVLCSLRMTESFFDDRYNEKTLSAAQSLSRLCITGVKVSVLINVIFNLLQLLFIGSLSSVSFNVSVPLFSLGFILLTLVFTDFIKDSKQLKEDNDSII